MKVLSIAFGETHPESAQWARVIRMAQGIDKIHHLKILSFTRNSQDLPKLGISGHMRVRIEPLGYNLLREIGRCIREFEPDVIFSNTHVPAGIMALRRSSMTPMLVDLHGLGAEEIILSCKGRISLSKSLKILANRQLERAAVRTASKILCVSHSMIDFLTNTMGVAPSKLHYATNGVDLEFFSPMRVSKTDPIRRKLGLDDKLVFGYIGNMQQWQGVDQFAMAAKRVSDSDVGFLIIGGDNAWSCRNIVKLPRLDQNILPQYYSICDVLVLPRPYHQATVVAAPTKFAEYIAMGKPILVTDVGDAAAFVRKYSCGIVVPSNHPRHLVKGFRAFQEESGASMRSMGFNSRMLAESEFDWTRVIEGVRIALAEVYSA